LYESGGHEVSLFVLAGETVGAADVTTFGHRSRIWSRGPTTFVLISPASAGEMPQVVSYFQGTVQ
jgi:hypothetical protein